MNLSFWLQKHPGSLLEGFSQTQVSTLAVKDKLLVAGGFQGELICKVIPFVTLLLIMLKFAPKNTFVDYRDNDTGYSCCI